MIRPIVLYGDSVLRSVSSEINKESKFDIRPIINDMFETMHKARGVGLAAIQIDIPLRLFIIEAHIEEENFHFRGIFINPKILKKGESFVDRPEGCLSVPQLAAPVSRCSDIELEWYDENWKYHKEEFTGNEARMIQHEYDHLDGKLYIDFLSYMWSKTFEISLDLIKERKMEVPYLCK